MFVNKKILLVLTSAILVLSGFLFWSGLNQTGPKTAIEPITLDSQPKASEEPEVLGQFQQTAKVLNVIDGDTIEVELNGQVKKIRYIGIDTPETVDPRRPVGCFGKQASEENKRLVEGKTIFLEKDVSETDKFGRLLRYLYIRLDNGSYLFINDYLVREGYAFARSFPPDIKYSESFKEAERQARENLRGLWQKCQ